MEFHGLFIGIDRYASTAIKWLSCARRDAVAMYALFSDTLGDGATLLVDAAATRVAIEAQFTRLSSVNTDDVVVIYFSGHGTTTHQLVSHDTDPHSLYQSTISLDTLTEWFSHIPASRLICILDCCFSGGMGAKVLKSDLISREFASSAAAIDQLAGDGRLILTASSPTEEAWENNSIGHGLLTYYLLEALQGAEEVRRAGKISVYRLFEYVTERVKNDAAQFGKSQHPTLRATIDDNLTWPVFTPGQRYLAEFPDRGRVTISPDIGSLTVYGFPQGLIDAWKGAIPSLNTLQIQAINDFDLLRGAHLVVSAPTSSGKTMIGELAALRGCLERKRAFFLLPLKALVNDKHQQFSQVYADYGIKTIRATGEITDDIPDLMRGQYDICLMTYEKFSALALIAPYILEQVGTIVVDEVQMIADASRGANLEFILTVLRIRRQAGIQPQLICLSAVIGDTNGLERWLGARLLRRTERPIPLDEGILRADGSFRYLDPAGVEQVIPNYIQRQWGKGTSQDWIIPLVRRLVEEGKQVIVFREQRGETRGCALYLARELGLPPAQAALDALPADDLSGASAALREALVGGVAFHNSNLSRDERLVIEEQFRAQNTPLRVIVATTTLAMGINTPAEVVIVVGLQHPGPTPTPYSIAEYKNIVGRAGRLGYSERGASFLMALTGNEEHHAWKHYLLGQPENIVSRFLARGTDPRSLIVRILAAVQRFSSNGLSGDDIIAFLEGSFGAFQQKQYAQTWQWDRTQFTQALRSLEQHQLIQLNSVGIYELTPIGQLAGESGVEVETITRLVEAIRPLSAENLNEPTLVALTQLSVELDNVFFPINKASKQKEPQYWSSQLRNAGVAPHVFNSMQRNVAESHQVTLRAKRAASCLMWMSDMPLSEVERQMTQFGGATDGAAGPIRAVSARSCDILPAVIRIAEVLHPNWLAGKRTAELLTRLEVGIAGQAADLAKYVGSRLSRMDYQRLVAAGITSVAGIESASDDRLRGCLEASQRADAKLTALRGAVQRAHTESREVNDTIQIIPPYSSQI